MVFGIQAFYANPIFILLFTVAAGTLVGRIKIGNFAFGVAGTFFIGLLIGWVLNQVGHSVLERSIDGISQKTAEAFINGDIIPASYFDFFVIIFIACVGLVASRDLKTVIKRYGVRFIILGVVMASVGALTTYALWVIPTKGDGLFSNYEITGIYTGALTSTPGLAAALDTATGKALTINGVYIGESLSEKQKILDILAPGSDASITKSLTDEQVNQYVRFVQQSVGTGYAVAYPVGVFIILLAMSLIPKILGMDLKTEWNRHLETHHDDAVICGLPVTNESPFDVTAFVSVCLVGFLLGKVEVHIGEYGIISLGTAGGVLLGAIVYGLLAQSKRINYYFEKQALITLRQFSIAFFLACLGLKYGGSIVDTLNKSGFSIIGASIIIALSALIAGIVLGRYVFRFDWIILSGALCGGMTSTTGLGAAIDAIKSEEPALGYSATYPFALLTKVILVIGLNNLTF